MKLLASTIVQEKRILLSNGRFLQVGALVYRFVAEQLQILLITSRRSRRWIIPKGWPMPGKTLVQAAMQEAYEEAGVRGEPQAKPLGRYAYEKTDTPKGKNGRFTVEVFAVHFTCQEKTWPERGQRIFEWMAPEKAARQVNEPELQQLIVEFADGHNCPVSQVP